MKKILLISFGIILLGLYGQNLFASRVITGVVCDDSNQVLPGVNVVEKGTSHGTITDVNGKYTIKISDSTDYLVFSFIGMKSKEVYVRNNSTINVILSPDQCSLEECVVIGYGVQKKSMVTVAVSAVALAGRVPQSRNYSLVEDKEDYAIISGNKYLDPKQSPLSTFSVDVDNASYSNIRRFINNGQLPPHDAVRIEEMINYFNYDYEGPKDEKPFAVYHELAKCPWNKNHNLLQVALQGKRIEKANLPPSNLVFLIDVSGSMNATNKLPLLKSALKMLVNELREEDKVSIVVYAGAAGVVLEPTGGDNKSAIVEALDKLSAGGSTAGGEGLKMAYKLANENFLKDGNNRIILATDGDFNVGISSNLEMERLIEAEREKGVYITVAGFGVGNYKDSKMEIIADKGNGNYFYIDSFMEAKKALVEEFGGTLYTIAKDVKFQLEFNPQHIAAYRLIGYENRILNKEDFNNDKVDAGEIGSGHSVTALYEIIPIGADDIADFLPGTDPLKYQENSSVKIKSGKTNYSNELLTVKLRYKLPDENKSKLITVPILNKVKELKDASNIFSFVSGVAAWGMKLRGEYYVNEFEYDDIVDWIKKSNWNDEQGYSYEMIRLINSSNHLSEEIAKN